MSVTRLMSFGLGAVVSAVLAGCVVMGCGGGAGKNSAMGTSGTGTAGTGASSSSSTSSGASTSGSTTPTIPSLGAPLATVNVNGWITDFAVNQKTNTLYAVIPAWGTSANGGVGQTANSPDGSLVGVDGATGSVTATVSLPPSTAAYAFTGNVAADPTTNMVYISDETDQQVIAINGATNGIVARIPVGNQPSGIAADPATGMVYVANSVDGTVSVIDETTNTVSATFSDGFGGTVDNGTGLAESVAVNSAAGLVYVSDVHYATVAVISEKTNQVQDSWKVGNGPTALLYDSANNSLYVSDFSLYSLQVLNASTGVSNATIQLDEPAGLVLDPTTDTVYASTGGGSTVTAISGKSNSVVAQGQVVGSGSAYSVAVDSTNDVVYAPTNLNAIESLQGLTQ